MMDDHDKIAKLERSNLELGTELYRVKLELDSLRRCHERVLQSLTCLGRLLDDKSLIGAEEFADALDLEALIADSPLRICDLNQSADDKSSATHLSLKKMAH